MSYDPPKYIRGGWRAIFRRTHMKCRGSDWIHRYRLPGAVRKWFKVKGGRPTRSQGRWL